MRLRLDYDISFIETKKLFPLVGLDYNISFIEIPERISEHLNITEIQGNAPDLEQVFDITQYRNFNYLLRITLYVLRFIVKLKMRTKQKSPNSEYDIPPATAEMNNAETLWVRRSNVNITWNTFL